MDIRILHGSEGAQSAIGLAVVIDVFRAFSVAGYIFSQGAERIIAVREVERAWQLKREHPDHILIGERHAKKLPGFEYGNSPTELQGADLSGKTVIQTTHAGTQSLLAAHKAPEVITGSFVNAGAIIRYIRKSPFNEVSLVCAGFRDEGEALEDTLCAHYIRDSLAGQPRPFDEIVEQLRLSGSAARFFDPREDASPESDFWLCLRLDRFSFVIRRTAIQAGSCVLEKVAVD
jgi:2-phosphosulfolactate phosphatase